MKLNEIKKNLLPEDYEIAAVTNEVTSDYIYKLMRGVRADKSDKAKDTLKTLRRLATVNIKARKNKERVAGCVINL